MNHDRSFSEQQIIYHIAMFCSLSMTYKLYCDDNYYGPTCNLHLWSIYRGHTLPYRSANSECRSI